MIKLELITINGILELFNKFKREFIVNYLIYNALAQPN